MDLLLTASLYSNICFLIADVSTQVTKSSKFLENNIYKNYCHICQLWADCFILFIYIIKKYLYLIPCYQKCWIFYNFYANSNMTLFY